MQASNVHTLICISVVWLISSSAARLGMVARTTSLGRVMALNAGAFGHCTSSEVGVSTRAIVPCDTLNRFNTPPTAASFNGLLDARWGE